MFDFLKKRTADPALKNGDTRYLTQLRAAQIVEDTPRITWALYLMLTIVVTAIVWASIARVDEVTRADGRVVPDGREQVIASLEGGLLRELYVREGMQVQEGQELVQLDPTRFESQQNEGQAKRLALKGTVSRLSAEAMGRPLKFPPDVTESASIVAAETEAYGARKYALDAAVSANQRSVALLMKELGVSEAMAAKGLMSDVEVMRLRRQVNDLQLQSQERVNKFRQDASTELVRVQTELAQLDEQIAGRADVLRRTVLTSPVRGLVKNIRTNTIGGVVSPGAPIMEIVPLSSRVLVEARIKPKDIGFVRVGQAAEVKLAAYDYTTFGGVKGKIEYISPDALGEADKGVVSDQTYYRVLVRGERITLKQGGKPLSVLPGMTAVVEVRTGERSVLDFILRPMMKSREAFRER
ncbi:HlyD family type I secretion periplasmic adaptor subunit [Piscinibacter gummiphilus]|uniref:HlyD family type I secretion periplasmic adaptor subunit n=1 Tax=Piscinibacter gummiphilus TaxID=946333 RepID=UPI000A26D33E|nr:HlyD family type I secretion periplasmic adaptor subunit [Piscinibacter gummiphilus]ATU65145.1 HlyD family type I secretion periplasmic adaptor subunit [Piscinibacter gummiphilus]GLS98458.1 HlyD family type I secretion periplasmic adaptor subunit [Piscinibacter gummiphilus]